MHRFDSWLFLQLHCWNVWWWSQWLWSKCRSYSVGMQRSTHCSGWNVTSVKLKRSGSLLTALFISPVWVLLLSSFHSRFVVRLRLWREHTAGSLCQSWRPPWLHPSPPQLQTSPVSPTLSGNEAFIMIFNEFEEDHPQIFHQIAKNVTSISSRSGSVQGQIMDILTPSANLR